MLKSLVNASRQLRAGKDHDNPAAPPVSEPAGDVTQGESRPESDVPIENRDRADESQGLGAIPFSYNSGSEESGLNIYVTFDDFVHVGFRPRENKIVLNTYTAGTWETERNLLGELRSGLYELDLGKHSEIALHFAGSSLISLALPDRRPLPLTRLHKICAYGDVRVLTPDGELLGDTHSPMSAVQQQGGDFLPMLRDRTPGFLDSLRAFDLQTYVDLNPDLHGRFTDRGEALEHFVNEGIDQLRQFNGAEIFDPAFYQTRYDDAEDLSPSEAYAHWLSFGRQEGRAPSEAILLKRLGLTIQEIPSSFTAERYAKPTIEWVS